MITDPESWTRAGQYHWTLGPFTICMVRIKGVPRYELWRDRSFVAQAPDAAPLRELAAQAGVQL